MEQPNFCSLVCPKVHGQALYSVIFKSAWGSSSNRQTCNESRELRGLEGIKADSAGLNVRYMTKTETPAHCAEYSCTSESKTTKCRAGKTRCFVYEEKFKL